MIVNKDRKNERKNYNKDNKTPQIIREVNKNSERH